MVRGLLTRLLRISPSSSSSHSPPSPSPRYENPERREARLEAEHKQRVERLTAQVKNLMRAQDTPPLAQSIVRWALAQVGFSHDIHRARTLLNPEPAGLTLMVHVTEAEKARDRRTARALRAIHMLGQLEVGASPALRHEIHWASGILARIFPFNY